MIIIFRHTSLLSKPIPILKSFIIQTTRSAIFLATYVTLCWASPCAMRNLIGRDYRWM